MSTPSIHYLLEFWKIFRCLIIVSLFNFIVRTNIPEVSPLCIIWWRSWSNRHVLLCIFRKAFSMILSSLFILRSSSNLIISLWIDVFCWFICIVVFWSSIEEFLYHINKSIILGLINSWVFYNETTIFMKCLCYLFTVLFSWRRFC